MRTWGFTLVPLLWSAAVGAQTQLAPGQPFPALQLPAMEDGRPRSIVEFRGRKLILHIFASW